MHDQIFGHIERITFHNPENGFTVARLKQPKKETLTTIVGVFVAPQAGERVRCMGQWKNSPSHGMQFEISECNVEPPSTAKEIQKYLESGLIRGIGPTYAGRIVEAFGTKTLEILDHHPERLAEISGIGSKRLSDIMECWQSQKTIREVMFFLSKYEISPTYAHKIYKAYGQESIEYVQDNPFSLAKHIPGIGFKKADALAEKMGLAPESEQRVEAGIEFLLSQHTSEGHVCYPRDKALEEITELLQLPLEIVTLQLDKLIQKESFVARPLTMESVTAIYLWSKSLYLCEAGIQREMERIAKGHSNLRSIQTEHAMDWAEKQLNLTLAEKQKEALQRAIDEKLLIITGGPGTGKSTITKAILAIMRALRARIILAAPTGRAAKRMTEITHFPALTIHALLQYDFKLRAFRCNKENPLECDLIIIDEASMIDTSLMYHLLKAIPTQARLIFVGDIHQLPSVGPGNVLKSFIESAQFPVAELNAIFRQAAGSLIITNAHKINQGIFPDLHSERRSDFFFVKAETPEEVLNSIIELVTQRLPKTYGFKGVDEIQVLSPMKRGLIGIENLNIALQSHVNPQGESIMQGGQQYRVGDKVMQIRNNYQKEVYNGDLGKISHIEHSLKELDVNFEGKTVVYSFHELDELTLAYACSVHKFQGSEYPCVVIPIHTQHYTMLGRPILYTAVTRGKRLVVIVGTVKAIAIAVQNDSVKKRFSGLTEELMRSKA